MKLSVLIPVYNEVGSIATVVERVAAVPIETEIILIDDFSTDGSGAVIDALPQPDLVIVHHDRNRGKGAAVRTALAQATGDVIVIQDADLEYAPADFVRLLEPIALGRVKVVYGYRDFEGQRWPLRVGNRFLTAVTNLLFGSDLRDMETCYKMIDRELAAGLALTADRFEIEVELTSKLLKSGEQIEQLPISYEPRQGGKKLVPWIDGPQGLWALIKHRWFV
ncbi:MAG: glycosyltransferase family 2 protein [Chloroflexota bacterium]|jgi:glycosyltransferase involved in cell wall biosynthesis|nr:glycosyltransferase family 2 protein [Chloroflexota bacterium]MDP6508850.1 glycosyltransferase family 2 protein [Chloroflexota bacterium]MDP6758789.1 glycosyltransferase family 2 protein [Chloroflexota bacterium]